MLTNASTSGGVGWLDRLSSRLLSWVRCSTPFSIPFRAALSVALLGAALSGCGGGSSGGGSAAPAAEAPRPNILVVIADDLGYGDLGCYGSANIATPRLDQMAAEGVKFDSFYTHSVCTPTRAALMTGRYALRVNLPQALGPWSETGLRPSEYTVAESLKAAGYRTALFGKWHLGDAPEQLPIAQGFDEYAGLPWGPTGIPTVEFDSATGQIEFEPDPVTQSKRAADRSLDFMERAAASESRFFCVTSFVAPHKPAVSGPDFVGTSADGRDYGDAVQEMDFHVGRLLDRLDALGLGEDTLVLFLSDNGAGTGEDPYQNGSNGILRGSKGSSFEGGIRVPAIARWTGEINPGRVESVPVAVTDLMPTFAALADAPLPGAIALDGVDHSTLLRRAIDRHPNRLIHTSSGFSFQAVRRGRYKYRLGEVFDVVDDPGETTNLAGAVPVLATELEAEVVAINAAVTLLDSGPALSSRTELEWRGGERHPAAPLDGDTWRSSGFKSIPLFLEDADPNRDVRVISSAGLGPPGVPANAMTVDGGSEFIRWVWRDAALDPFGPLTIGLWYRGGDPNPAEAVALVDVGDSAAGFSVTIGDAGIIGDDGEAGRRDDVLVRIGGSQSPTSGTVAFDLPGDASERFHHLLFRRGEDGDLVCFLDGFESARVSAPGADYGGAATWSFLSTEGELGGSAGPGILPFETRLFQGAVAGIQVSDRAMPLNEIQFVYCRYLHVPYCFGVPHSGGSLARLALSGSFSPSDNRLFLDVTSGPADTVGLALAGRAQGRLPFGSSNLCFTGEFSRFNAQVLTTGPSGNGTLRVPFMSAPAGFDFLTAGQDWNFQVWLRDGASSTTTNAVRVRFCL